MINFQTNVLPPASKELRPFQNQMPEPQAAPSPSRGQGLDHFLMQLLQEICRANNVNRPYFHTAHALSSQSLQNTVIEIFQKSLIWKLLWRTLVKYKYGRVI